MENDKEKDEGLLAEPFNAAEFNEWRDPGCWKYCAMAVVETRAEAVAVLVLGILLPGVGVYLASLLDRRPDAVRPYCLTVFCTALYQGLGTWLLIGWIWSVHNCWLIFRRQTSMRKKEE